MTKTKLLLLLSIISLHSFGQSLKLMQADSLFANGNYGKAVEIYEQLENEEGVYEKMALAYTAIGNYQKALEAYQLQLEVNPIDYKSKYDYGKLLSKTKKFKDASEVFSELIKIDSLNPDYFYQSGLVLEELNDSTAIARYTAAFKLDENHQKAIYKLAKFFLNKAKYDQSMELIDKGLSTYPENVELISLKAQNYYWQNLQRKAVVWFERLLELGESSEFIYEKLSQSYGVSYEFEKAIEFRKKLLQLNPKDVDSYKWIASYYQNLDNWAEAEEYQQKYLLLMDVSLSDDYKNLGVILNSQQKYKEAIDAFNMALDEDPANEMAAFYKSMSMSVYYADYDAKLAAFESFKKKFPNSRMMQSADLMIKKIKDEQFMKGESEKDSVKID